MKAITSLAFLAFFGCLVTVSLGDDDFMDDDLLEGLIIGGAIAQGQNCAAYGRDCGLSGKRCCQYIGYSYMACQNGMCLQQQCAGENQACDWTYHCCYHLSLRCSWGRCVRSYTGK